MNDTIRTIFFGSTTDSVIILDGLLNSSLITICAVITQPPRPIGRKQVVTPTPVEALAKEKNIVVLSFPSDPAKPSFYENEQVVIDTLAPFKTDLIISASYGQRIPSATLTSARYGGLNVHPSLLPRWRGADPVPWAIMSGDHQTGITIVTLSEQFDAGKIIAQKKIPITNKDFSDSLRAKLFTIGAKLLTEILPTYLASKDEVLKGSPVKGGTFKGSPYARRFTRDDGFEPWERIQKAFEDPAEAARIDRKFRALHPWPGLWSKITIQRQQQNDENNDTHKTTKITNVQRSELTTQEKKRVKILKLEIQNERLLLKTVQMEGKNPVPYTQFQEAYRDTPQPPPLDRHRANLLR